MSASGEHKRIIVLAIYIVFHLCLTGCKSTIIDAISSNHQKAFEEFWTMMNYRYVYWDKDPTDWDQIYRIYTPLFAKLGQSNEDNWKAKEYYEEITQSLIDGHFRLSFSYSGMEGVTITPSLTRLQSKHTDYGAVDYNALASKYLDYGYFDAKGSIVRNGARIRILLGTISKDILYFRCNFFDLKRTFDSSDGNDARSAIEQFFSVIKHPGTFYRGLIIDLRDNPGGVLSDFDFLVPKLINSDLVYGFSRSKSGLGKFDYLPWVPAYVRNETSYDFSPPIIFLSNHFTASLAETIIIALRQASNCRVVGTPTYGATGPLSDRQIFNSGSFIIKDYMDVQTSSAEFKDADGRFYESNGIHPDIYIPLDHSQTLKDIDNQLEMAIKKLYSK